MVQRKGGSYSLKSRKKTETSSKHDSPSRMLFVNSSSGRSKSSKGIFSPPHDWNVMGFYGSDEFLDYYLYCKIHRRRGVLTLHVGVIEEIVKKEWSKVLRLAAKTPKITFEEIRVGTGIGFEDFIEPAEIFVAFVDGDDIVFEVRAKNGSRDFLHVNSIFFFDSFLKEKVDNGIFGVDYY